MADTSFDLSYLSYRPAELQSFMTQYFNTIGTSQLQTAPVVTYSFYTDVHEPAERVMEYPLKDREKIFQAFNDAEKSETHAMIAYLENATGMHFQEVAAGEGAIRLGKYNMSDDLMGYTYLPTDFPQDASYAPLFINSNIEQSGDVTQTLWHEFGHAIGLKHPGPYGAGDFAPYLPPELDTSILTVMSYNDYKFNVSYSVLDLAVLANKYGPSTSTADLTYVFTHSQTESLQSVEGNQFEITIPGNSIFWAYINPGHTSLDLSATAQDDNGIVLQNGIGSLAWSQGLTTLSITDYMNKATIPTSAQAFGNVRLYTTGKQTVHIVPHVLLTPENDVINLDPAGGMIQSIDAADGRDTFNSFENNAQIHGGNDLDQWSIEGALASYKISGSTERYSLTNPDEQAMVFSDIERVHFSDYTLGFDFNGSAGETYRLYGALERAPDFAGLGNWIHLLDVTTDLGATTTAFMAEPEFISHYAANSSNGEFVQSLYTNVLHREADAQGMHSWVAQLDAGDLSRAQVLTGFTESTEYAANIAADIAYGIQFTDYTAIV